MSYTSKFAEVLRKAASKMERDGFNYDWGDCARCNCGYVAQVAMRMSADKIDDLMDNEDCPSGTWTEMAKEAFSKSQPEYCSTTGIPLNQVFRELYNLGMKPADFRRIEYLSDPQLREIAGVTRNEHVDNGAVAKYLRAFADKVDQEIAERSKAAQLLKDVRKATRTPLPQMETVQIGDLPTKQARTAVGVMER